MPRASPVSSSPFSRLQSLSPSLSPPPPRTSGKSSQHIKLASVKQKKGKATEIQDDDEDNVAPLKKKQKTTHICTTETQETPEIIRRYEILLTSTKQMTRISNGVEYLYQAARTLPRHVGTCVNYAYVLTEGLHRNGQWERDEIEQQVPTWDPWWEVFVYFDIICKQFPGLHDHMRDLRERPELVGQLARWMNSVAGKARGDDISRLKDKIISLAKLADTSGLEAKTSRGFKHPETGRMLCPIKLLDDFDANPEKFCRMVRDRKEGHPRVGGGDYPLFMYDMKAYVPGKLKPGFLKSKFLVDCAKVVFTGPSSTSAPDSELTGRSKGKPPICRTLNMTSINFISIVYIAILARFCLNSQSEWQERDIDFSSEEFMCNVMTISMRSDKWHDELCEWYTRQLFQQVCEDEGVDDSVPSAHELLLAEIAQEQEEEAREASIVEAEEDEGDEDQEEDEGGDEDAEGVNDDEENGEPEEQPAASAVEAPRHGSPQARRKQEPKGAALDVARKATNKGKRVNRDGSV
ncbi:hypothetical protein PYCCODRAFT_1390008 [Trametes coccinea BRFM310]|uniref:Uncharacterized protein n=1 Tax=Trametes coccinea (strain BRFM310) TaxID=1353009 RepID=A0A1Y2IMP2_TRAC3|nr:hypothetical protein PYCCODRAFT_1390008 [Trametes coccinea BRFM310]